MYGNNSTYGDCTKFYQDSSGLDEFIGFDQWFTNGVAVVRIDNNGNVTSTSIC
jgi:hypothetical protein